MGCINGEVVDSCTEGNPAADDTTCNGIDEDCDGEVDEEYVETPTTCGEGACSDTGVRKCIAGNEVDTCEPGHASDEDLCDGFEMIVMVKLMKIIKLKLHLVALV